MTEQNNDAKWTLALIVGSLLLMYLFQWARQDAADHAVFVHDYDRIMKTPQGRQEVQRILQNHGR
jgi:GH35 family endo-1,4-beta-xylanase